MAMSLAYGSKVVAWPDWSASLSLEKPRFYWGKWRAQGDDLRTFLTDFVAALPQIDFPGVNLPSLHHL